MNHREALLLLLDCIDYESGACRVNEPIGGVLPVEVLRRAKLAAQQQLAVDTALPVGECPFCVRNEPHLKEHCYREIRRAAKA